MAEHTPGPWRVGRSGSVVADHPVPEISGSNDVKYYGGHLIAESIAPQNAALIAAAPELLAALSWFIDDLSATDSSMQGFDANVRRARAAIKAAGGS